MTDRQSFERLQGWYDEVIADSKGKNLPVVLLALKSDLAEEGQREISQNEGITKQKTLGSSCFLFREISTFTSDN